MPQWRQNAEEGGRISASRNGFLTGEDKMDEAMEPEGCGSKDRTRYICKTTDAVWQTEGDDGYVGGKEKGQENGRNDGNAAATGRS